MIPAFISPNNSFRGVTTALLLLASVNLSAQTPLSMTLNGASEVPPVTTSATGTAQITILPDHTVSGTIKTFGISSTVAHVHEAAAGKSGPAIITLSKTTEDGFVVPAGAKLTDAQYASYLAGNLYVNVHSAQYPNGEIRAQLRRTETDAKSMR